MRRTPEIAGSRMMAPMDRTSMTSRHWLMLAALAALWGGSFTCYKILDDAALPPLTIAAARVTIAAAALLAVLAVMRRTLPRARGAWLAFFGMGVFNNALPYTAIAFGESHIESGLASILNATTPIFTILVAAAATTERPRVRTWIGIAIAFAGVVVLIGPAAIRGLNLTSVAQLACLGGALSYGIAAVYARRFRELGIAPLGVATGQLVAATAIMIPLALAVDRPWRVVATVPANAWIALVVLALVCTAVAYILYFGLIAAAGATNASLVTFLVPVSALALGALLLGEHLAPLSIAGGTLILAGLAALR